jgi:potassium-transporting ATPase KdpC subunit
MGNDFTTALRPAIVLTILFALLLGILYPLAITGVAQLAFPHQANGSVLRDAAGKAIGSELIGQNFSGDRYFHPRPSAAGKTGYDSTASSGSNLGPASQALVDRVTGDIATARKQGIADALPADLVTASGSGLDPDISPANALLQADRVAKARSLPLDRVRQLVAGATETPTIPFLGDPHVNVLALNRRLDAAGVGAAR